MSRLTEKHLLPIKLMVFDAENGRILSPMSSANYPVATPLTDFLRTTLPQIDLSQKQVAFLTNVDDRFVERIDVENPRHTFYHVLAVLQPRPQMPLTEQYQNRQDFLNSLPVQGEERNRLQRFLLIRPLHGDHLLELSGRMVRLSSFSLPTELAHALKGILFLEKEAQGFSLAYYTRDRILHERFQIGEDKTPQRVEKQLLLTYRDIASRNEPFGFHIIRRAFVRNDLLLVDHFTGQGRELKTFQREVQQDKSLENKPENRSQQPISSAYRDTGNRVLSMNLLHDNQARLDFSFIVRELDLEAGFRYMLDYLEAAHQQLVAIHEVGTNEWYLLTRDEQHRDYRIYHSRTPRRRLQEPLAAFTLPDVPVALLWLQELEVALIASSTHLYLIEPGSHEPLPQKLNELLRTSRERFEVYGEVQDLTKIRFDEGEAVVIVQDQRILLTLFEDYL